MSRAYELLVKVDPEHAARTRERPVIMTSATIRSTSRDREYRVSLDDTGKLVISNVLLGLAVRVEELLDAIDALSEAHR